MLRLFRGSSLSVRSVTIARTLASAAANPAPPDYMKKTRNIGISAHIDSGKTTLTERILYYTGRINEIHDVRGKDGIGAKMDSMDLEREKGITIQSAATFCQWQDNHINIIDTPGHVDFTIEVERALRVLDGAVLVVCAASGVQSQTLTVDRQMKRYKVPRVVFINKCDRMGANPFKAINAMRKELSIPACAIQIPIGLEENHEGVVDLITGEAIYFRGNFGNDITRTEIPAHLQEQYATKRQELIETLANLDEVIGEKYLMEEEPTPEEIRAAIRRGVVTHKFIPVMMGAAYKNKGVQELLNGVIHYLPNPTECENVGFDLSQKEKEVALECTPNGPFVGLAFKLEESKYGQLTYMRVYQGTMRKGMQLHNMTNSKKVKVPRIVRMHANEMEEVESASAGDVVAVFGIECASMDTFTDGSVQISMKSMFVPNPVMALAVKPKESSMATTFAKAMGKFTREDPTLRLTVDPKTNETVMSGMGELHLEIYVERLKREYNVQVITGTPSVNYKEAITQRGNFNYLHKKQSGGSGQFGRVIGYVEPLEDELIKQGIEFEFENKMIGNNIPPEYLPSCEKGAKAAAAKGVISGHPLTGMRVVITDGAAHAVDSNDIAFQLAMMGGIREGIMNAKPVILEPMMSIEIAAPSEFQGSIMGNLSQRGGLVTGSEVTEDGANVVIKADAPLSQLFGYSTDLRSSTQGKGEFSMEYKSHEPVMKTVQAELIKKYADRHKEDN